jgi:tetratricopeptide (TPR) repeat protein
MGKLAPDRARVGRRKVAIFASLALLAAGGLTMVYLWSLPDAETLSRRARQAFMERRFDEAEADIIWVNALRDPTPLDLMLAAQFAIQKGRTDEALAALAKVPDDYSMAGQARLEAGQLELRRSRYVAAERWFLEAVRLDPKLVQARRELIYIYGMQLRRPELNASFRELAKLSTLTYPEVFLWCLSRGVSWEATEIVETLKKCLEADPTDRWARLGLAESLRELNRFDEADAALAPLPESDPVARPARVRIAMARGDDQLAESLMAKGPVDDVDFALLRGRFALSRGETAEAVHQFRIAYEKAPTLREAVLSLGQALRATGDPAAGPLLEEVVKHERLNALVQKAASDKNRDDLALMRDLGEACAALGRFPEAHAWYNLAITKDPFDIPAQDGVRRLKELEAKAANPGPK